MELKDTIYNGISKLLSKSSEENLGNRSKYIGASEINTCPLKVYYQKTDPVLFDAHEQEVVFLRGHIAQEIIEKALKAMNKRFKTEVEVVHPDFSFLMAHIDILFETKREYFVVECKSGDSNTCQESWVKQLQFQMGLLKLNNPEKEIKGTIVHVNVKTGEINVYNSFTPDESFEQMVQKGLYIWNCIRKETPPKPQPDYLCGWCSHNSECSVWQEGKEMEVSPEIKAKLDEFFMTKTALNGLKKEEKKLKEELSAIFPNGKFDVGGYLIKKSEITSRRLDNNKLSELYPEVAADENLYNETSYEKLEIKKKKN